jgi:hypothetical protein
MSQLLPAEVWHSLYLRLLRHRSLISESPGLASILPALESMEADLALALSGHDSQDPELLTLRRGAAEVDMAHDEAHALLRELMRTATHETGDPDGVIARGLQTLYPDGLAFTHDAWALEVLHSAAFASRLEHPDVRHALERVASITPDIGSRVADCLREGHRLGTALDTIEAHIIALSGGNSSKAHIFELRMRARELWVEFMRALDTHHPAGLTLHDPLRAKLLSSWERAHRIWQIDESDGE